MSDKDPILHDQFQVSTLTILCRSPQLLLHQGITYLVAITGLCLARVNSEGEGLRSVKEAPERFEEESEMDVVWIGSQAHIIERFWRSGSTARNELHVEAVLVVVSADEEEPGTVGALVSLQSGTEHFLALEFEHGRHDARFTV